MTIHEFGLVDAIGDLHSDFEWSEPSRVLSEHQDLDLDGGADHRVRTSWDGDGNIVSIRRDRYRQHWRGEEILISTDFFDYDCWACQY